MKDLDYYNLALFRKYNIGDKLMITDHRENNKVMFGILQNFGYSEDRRMRLWVDMVGAKAIVPLSIGTDITIEKVS